MHRRRPQTLEAPRPSLSDVVVTYFAPHICGAPSTVALLEQDVSLDEQEEIHRLRLTSATSSDLRG